MTTQTNSDELSPGNSRKIEENLRKLSIIAIIPLRNPAIPLTTRVATTQPTADETRDPYGQWRRDSDRFLQVINRGIKRLRD